MRTEELAGRVKAEARLLIAAFRARLVEATPTLWGEQVCSPFKESKQMGPSEAGEA